MLHIKTAALVCLLVPFANSAMPPPDYHPVRAVRARQMREASSPPPSDLAPREVESRADREESSLPPPNFHPDSPPRHLASRQSADPPLNLALWAGDAPSFSDIKQVAVLDCWLAAAALSVVITSSNWMSQLFYFPNGTKPVGQHMPSADTVTVTLWDPKTLQPYNLTTHNPPREVWKQGHKTENNPGSPWWPSAIIQAILLLGKQVPVTGIMPNGTIDPRGGSAYNTLSVLTGYEAIKRYHSDYASVDEFFGELSNGYWTPVVINTPSNVTDTGKPQIGSNHGYAVMYTTNYGNGTRTATLRNPWGSTEEYEINVLFSNTAGVGHLRNWNYLAWPLQ